MGLFTNNLITRTDTVARHINGISCDVKGCVYHDGDNFCTANRVSIGGIYASSASQTRCATFKARGEITRR